MVEPGAGSCDLKLFLAAVREKGIVSGACDNIIENKSTCKVQCNEIFDWIPVKGTNANLTCFNGALTLPTLSCKRYVCVDKIKWT